ncbi:pre-mRNA-processing factor 39 isoform X2 [Amia ocellicauda]|uniref:pre-mRNA-processing factor 39 isoform X2 n=1 Tax=Amia ocellicauda TaxID=2972642 RepID=UPI003463B6F7
MAAESSNLDTNGEFTAGPEDAQKEGLASPEVEVTPPADPPTAPCPPPPEVKGQEDGGDKGDKSGQTSVSVLPGSEAVELYPAALEDYGEGEESEGELPAEFERLWRAAQETPQDFSSWTDLLQYTEQEGHMGAARRAFWAFFARYPLCYGYWKKFADMEKRAGSPRRAQEVCLQGLQAIPLSLDLWIHYISLLQETLNMNLPESTQRIRSAFESAVSAAGLEFRSDRLWEMFVDWEREQGELRAVTAVFDRVLSMPTQLYSQHYQRFKEHVESHSPRDILSTEDFLKLRSEVMRGRAAATPVMGREEVPPGEDGPPGISSANQETEEEEQKVRELLLASRQEVHQQTEVEVSKRWAFEEAIKRPYFHVKPLDRGQLRAWQNYLTWETANGDHRRVTVLHERCVIACALYEEAWIRYTRYLEQHSVDGSREVFRRACEIHLPKKPNIHLQWASFEERQGNVEGARRLLERLELAVPGLAVVRLRRAGLERRSGFTDRAESLLREAVQQSQATPLHAFYSIKLARLLLRVQRNPGKARRVLQDAIESNPENSKLHLNLLELECSADLRQNESNVLRCLARALAAPLPASARLLFSQRRLEFQEDFGHTVQSLLNAYDDHQALLQESNGKKRGAENGDPDDPEEKKAKSEENSVATTPSMAIPPTNMPMAMTPPVPMMGGDMGGGSQAAYGYGAWYQQQQQHHHHHHHHHQQQQYAGYGYQNPWSYNQYYPPS